MPTKNRRTSNKSTERIRVAIIGGGCAGMAAAFDLTSPELEDRYEVTVYQVGHRLGGKGASGRGVNGRIEEHGLHLWMGYYDNAFRMMRRCFDDLDRDPQTCPIVDIESAFEPAPVVGLTERLPSGGWFPWLATFPMTDERPGDPAGEQESFNLAGYVVRAAELLVELAQSAHNRTDPRAGPQHSRRARSSGERRARRRGRGADPRSRSAGESSPRHPISPSLRDDSAVLEAIDRTLKYGQLATTASIVEALETFHAALTLLVPEAARSLIDQSPLQKLADALSDAARAQIEVMLDADHELRRIWEVIDILLAITRGVLRAGIMFRRDGLDSLDAYDYREWLYDNGASPRSLDGAFLRGVYDLLFAYEGARPDKPRFAAGVAVRGTFRMFFTYRGALFYRMNAGMGDVVFAPLYQALKRRGVKFAFFHRLRDVHVAPEDAVPSGEEPWVTELHFDVQAKPLSGLEYDPLINVKGLPCWPSTPLFDQLENGEKLLEEKASFESHWDSHCAEKKALEVGRDFDLAVLAIGVAAIPHAAPTLMSRSAKLKLAVKHIKTVATQAFQLWMTEDMRDLGWHGGRVNVSGFVEPFDTWADMTHLLGAERWSRSVRSIAYFCSVLPDEKDPYAEGCAERKHEEVKGSAIRMLRRDIAALWPDAVDDRGDFRWEILADPSHGKDASRASEPAPADEGRFDGQYWTANVSPSDRYAQAVPGTTVYRISPLEPGFANLTFAGDWTETGLNSGCVESAVMGGRLAAHALSGFPHLAEITGYDHP